MILPTYAYVSAVAWRVWCDPNLDTIGKTTLPGSRDDTASIGWIWFGTIPVFEWWKSVKRSHQ